MQVVLLTHTKLLSIKVERMQAGQPGMPAGS